MVDDATGRDLSAVFDFLQTGGVALNPTSSEKTALTARLFELANDGRSDVIRGASRFKLVYGATVVELLRPEALGTLEGLHRSWDNDDDLDCRKRRATDYMGRGINVAQAIVMVTYMLGGPSTVASRSTVPVHIRLDNTVAGRLIACGKSLTNSLLKAATYCDYRDSAVLRKTLRKALMKYVDAGDTARVKFITDLMLAMACYGDEVLSVDFPVDAVTLEWLDKKSEHSFSTFFIDYQLDPEEALRI